MSDVQKLRIVKIPWSMDGKEGFTYYAEFGFAGETVQIRINGKKANLVGLEKIALDSIAVEV